MIKNLVTKISNLNDKKVGHDTGIWQSGERSFPIITWRRLGSSRTTTNVREGESHISVYIFVFVIVFIALVFLELYQIYEKLSHKINISHHCLVNIHNL